MMTVRHQRSDAFDVPASSTTHPLCWFQSFAALSLLWRLRCRWTKATAFYLVLVATACTKESQDEASADARPTANRTPVGGGISPNTSNGRTGLGVNVEQMQSGSPSFPLLDLFSKASPWVANDCTTNSASGTLSLDAQGWVTELESGQCADTWIFGTDALSYPVGTYVLLWEGSGTVEISGGVVPTITHKTSDSTETTERGLKRLTFKVTEANRTVGIKIRISATDADYMRNLRLLPPGGLCGTNTATLDYFSMCQSSRGGIGYCGRGLACFDFEFVYWDRFKDAAASMNTPGAVFHPQWLTSMKSFRALRFSEWLRPTDSTVVKWTERTSLRRQSLSSSTTAWPYEYLVALGNLLNGDVWINVPILADDDHVRRIAGLFFGSLNQNLRIYLEYGEENFNTAHGVPSTEILKKVNRSGSGIPSSDSDVTKIAKYSARRSKEIFAIWDGVFVAQKVRLTRVLAGDFANVDYLRAGLEFEGVQTSVDAIAISGHFGPERAVVGNDAAFDVMTADQILTEIESGTTLNSGTDLTSVALVYASHKTLADEFGVSLLGYESGVNLSATGGSTALWTEILAAHRDNRMGATLTQNLDNWRNAGGEIIFHSHAYSIWNLERMSGLYEFQGQDVAASVKASAVMTWIEANRCWWSGC